MYLRLLIVAATLFALASPLMAQGSPGAQVEATFARPGPHGPIVARLVLNEDRNLSGTIDFAGQYTVRLSGAVTGVREPRVDFAGQFTLTRSGAEGSEEAGNFEAAVDGDTLDITLVQPTARLPLQFQRVQPGASAEPPPTAAPAARVDGSLDPRLVGNWVHQTMIVSGDASMASERFLAFHADGTYQSGSGRSVAGGGGWSYDGGSGGNSERGRWRAADGVLYFMGQDGQWSRVGKYGMTTDGTTMRITNDRGGKVLWSRR